MPHWHPLQYCYLHRYCPRSGRSRRGQWACCGSGQRRREADAVTRPDRLQHCAITSEYRRYRHRADSSGQAQVITLHPHSLHHQPRPPQVGPWLGEEARPPLPTLPAHPPNQCQDTGPHSAPHPTRTRQHATSPRRRPGSRRRRYPAAGTAPGAAGGLQEAQLEVEVLSLSPAPSPSRGEGCFLFPPREGGQGLGRSTTVIHSVSSGSHNVPLLSCTWKRAWGKPAHVLDKQERCAAQGRLDLGVVRCRR